MGLNSILKIFTPANTVFFELFEKISENVAKSGDLLKQLVFEPDYDKRSTLGQALTDVEHASDELTHNVFTELSRNFITPFDREDIHYLAAALDDIVDYTYSAGKKMNFYRINPNETGFQKMAELIEQGGQHVKTAVAELRDMKKIRNITEALVKINSIENQADDVFDMSIEKLFNSDIDAKELIKRRDIYQVMELVTDKCEDAGNVIESIIIKYA
jgi:predicted phosphate transport protein (TIGR00153 family)